IAALLFAINPWQVVFSRKLWDVNLAAIFIFLFLLFVHNSIFTKKKHHIAYALACLGILLQLHLSLSYIALPALFLMIPNIRKIDKRYLAFGCLLFIVTTVPYAVFELKNNFSDVNILLEKSDEHYFHPNAFVIPFKMVSTAGFEGDFGTTFPIFISSLKYLYALDILAMIVLLLSLVYIATTKFRIFSLWFLLGIIYLSISKVPTIDTNYFTSLLPISFIIIGLAAASLIKRPNIKYVGYFILFIIVLHQFVFSLHFTNFVSEQECINGNYGMPYQYRLESIKENLQAFDDPIAYLKYINQISCDCRKCDIETAEYIIKKVI
ncbi:MAG: hypothetical protein KJ922_04380, partial [Nanoarchaeota archaeon]|nr:hypothetical protein [Nanoarchaeota archaeon]